MLLNPVQREKLLKKLRRKSIPLYHALMAFGNPDDEQILDAFGVTVKRLERDKDYEGALMDAEIYKLLMED